VAHIVPMPRPGNTVESCVLVGWRAREGETIADKAILCDVETDKAVFEVPAGAAGTILRLLVAEGDDVPVLAPIAVIGAPGEDWEAALGGARSAANIVAQPAAEEAPRLGSPPAKTPTTTKPNAATAAGPAAGVSPRARALAAKESVGTAALSGSGPDGRVIERDVLAALEGRPPLSAAARAAAAAGAGLPASGSGPGGRILVADLVAAGTPATGSAPRASPLLKADFPGPCSDTPLRSVRKVIADRMRESLAATAQYTLHAPAPAARLQSLRARFKTSQPGLGLSSVTIGDLVLFAVSRVLREHPACNAHKLGDSIRSFERVHLGLAVDTPRGLMVPVIRNADLLGLAAISAEAKRLATACVEGKASPDELSGSTFTVSNLGALGVDYFTPVINAPEVCVLGVGAIIPRPFAGPDGSYEILPSIGLSLTSDHQVVDGAPGARLLRDLVAALAEIDLWLAR
jgi:pyruvate dehydrogenase E2 component (dihydrolipoamide acetyltransferase)